MTGNGYPGFVEDRAIIEVSKVLEAVRQHGAYSNVIFDSPVTQAVIARAYGGWQGSAPNVARRAFAGSSPALGRHTTAKA